jgi:plasmid replication initiation protein
VIYPFNLPNIKLEKSYLTFTCACHEKWFQFFFCLSNEHTEKGNIYCICMSNHSVWFDIWVIFIRYHSLLSLVTVSFSKLTATLIANYTTVTTSYSLQSWVMLDMPTSCKFLSHSVMNYGLIFLGDSSYSAKVWKRQKNIIRLITQCRIRDSCKDLFKNLKILPLQSQYIWSLLLFVVKQQ